MTNQNPIINLQLSPNNISVFEDNRFGSIRTIDEDGKVLFCGNDIAKSLGYVNPQKAIRDHCKRDGGLKRSPIVDSLGRTQEAVFISEGDVYRLITHSKLPAAEEFERWVFDEVLPTIRKTGGYVHQDNQFVEAYLPFADTQTKMLFHATMETIRSLNTRIETDAPKVFFHDAVADMEVEGEILIGELAKMLRSNGLLIGQKRLFERLRDEGYLIKKRCGEYNLPTQRAMDLELFKVKETRYTSPDGEEKLQRVVRVTGKGQAYFIKRYLKEQKAAGM